MTLFLSLFKKRNNNNVAEPRNWQAASSCKLPRTSGKKNQKHSCMKKSKKKYYIFFEKEVASPVSLCMSKSIILLDDIYIDS